MQPELVSTFRKARFYGSVMLLYSMTLLFAAFPLNPAATSRKTFAATNLPIELTKQNAEKPIIAGKPIRIVISDIGIDLTIDEGRYNDLDGSWTLSGYHAHFAVLSPLANDDSGNTFIYGHNNKYVFGPLKKINPGAVAQVFTDNKHIFYYTFGSTYAVTPDDTSVLDYEGSSILTIQTCSGAWNEKRQMYTFNFDKVL